MIEVHHPYDEYNNIHFFHLHIPFTFISNTKGKYLYVLNECHVIQYDCWYSLQ